MHVQLNTVNHVLDFETFDATFTAEWNVSEIEVQYELNNLHVILFSEKTLRCLVRFSVKWRCVDQSKICSHESDHSGENAEHKLNFFTTKEILFLIVAIENQVDTTPVEGSCCKEDRVTQDYERNHENFDLNPSDEGLLRRLQKLVRWGTSIEVASNSEIEDLRQDSKDLSDEPICDVSGRYLREGKKMKGGQDKMDPCSIHYPKIGTGRLPFHLFWKRELVAVFARFFPQGRKKGHHSDEHGQMDERTATHGHITCEH